MNKEEYVTYEIAKLLKEKGFDWKTDFVWYEHLPLSISSDWRNKVNQKAMDYFYFNETTEHHSYYGNNDKKPSYVNGDIYSAPTQQMACRWLREEKDIDIIPFHEKLPNDCYWCRIEHNLFTAHEQEPIYSTYEDAVEAAILYVLDNLI